MLTKQEILLGRCAWVESSRVREPRTALPALAFMVMGLVSGLSLANHSDCPSWWCMLVQPRWVPEKRTVGGGWTRGVLF